MDKVIKQHPDMKVLKKAKFDEKGCEVNTDPPVELPMGFRHEPALHEMIKAYIRGAMSQQMAAKGNETFEEFNDFGDDEDEPLPASPHEFTEMHEEHLREFKEDVKKMSADEKEAAERAKRAKAGASEAKEVQTGAGGAGRVGAKNAGAGEPGSETFSDD